VLGVLEGEIAEQGVDRGQPVVAGGRAIVAVVFEMVQEGPDQRRVQVPDVQLAGRLARAPSGET
jgi:hypothetical protein